MEFTTAYQGKRLKRVLALSLWDRDVTQTGRETDDRVSLFAH